MTVTTSYPGVYLNESSSLNFSIANTASAVPAFAFYKTNSTDAPTQNIVRYDSWAEFISDGTSRDQDTSALYYTAIRTWFTSGGGRCYLVEVNHILQELPKYDDITLLVSTGKNNDIFKNYQALLDGGSNIFFLMDGPSDNINSANDPDDLLSIYPETPYGAVYYPWCSAEWSTGIIPPSAIAAAAIAKADRNRGVWKAPANIVIDGITPKYPVTDDLQGRFNQGKALNMIRTFKDVGTVVWGARTLEDSDNWRYIPVRRLFSMVERDIQKALNKLLFEPNSQPTWQKVKAAIDNYLYRLWQQGALAGNKEEEAWFVQIGKDITMTEDDISQGKMIVKIGLAASRPAEFILLQFTQDIAQ